MITRKHAYILTVASILTLNYSPIIYADNANDNSAQNESSAAKNIVQDAAITAAIKAKYLADRDIKVLDIQVETINGKVILSGIVPNKKIREKAVSIAKNTPGVREVISKIDISG